MGIQVRYAREELLEKLVNCGQGVGWKPNRDWAKSKTFEKKTRGKMVAIFALLVFSWCIRNLVAIIVPEGVFELCEISKM